MNWQDYQEAVAKALTEVGCQTQVEERVQGARGTHRVDVCARFLHHGITQLWIVECKALKKPVTKEKVLALQQIVADVGADRGLLFCEVGFQAGAITAATNSNITLTSIVDFRDNAQEQRQQLELRNIEIRCTDLENRFRACSTRKDLGVVFGVRVIESYMKSDGIDRTMLSWAPWNGRPRP